MRISPAELQNPTFRVSLALGLGPDPVVRRHDPSNIIEVDGLYHVYCTRYELPDMPFREMRRRAFLTEGVSEIWLATSADGLRFVEAGPIGQDLRDNGVFCPEALEDVTYGPGISWGLSLQRNERNRQHLVRLDCTLTVTPDTEKAGPADRSRKYRESGLHSPYAANRTLTLLKNVFNYGDVTLDLKIVNLSEPFRVIPPICKRQSVLCGEIPPGMQAFP